MDLIPLPNSTILMIDAVLRHQILNLPNKLIATVHKDPDFDAIGSLLSLGALVQSMGKSIDLFSPDINKAAFSNLPHINTLINKPSSHYDMAIFLDCSDESRIFDPITFPTFTHSINIDHHQDNTHFGTYNWVLEMSSVGEMMAHLFKTLNRPIDYDTAINLYAAICFDTGNFKFSNTQPSTFIIASELLSKGIPAHHISEWIFENKSEAYFNDVKSGLNHFYIDKHAPFGIVYIPFCDSPQNESTVNFFRQLKSIDLIIVCKEIELGQFKLSFRSKHTINVAIMAQHFNGGGHIRAAGANYKGTFSDLKKQLIRHSHKAFQ